MGELDSCTHILFSDESGNAGPNYLDADQPFHVDGGVLVPMEQVDHVRAIVQATIDGLKGGPREIKAQRLLRTRTGQRLVDKLLERVLATPGVLVVYCAAERRFSLAAKAVETLLDPFHNPSAPASNGLVAKEALWNRFYLLSDEALEPFAAFYRQPGEGELLLAIEALAEGLRGIGEEELAIAVEGAADHATTIVDEESFEGHNGFGHGHFAALNLPIYMHAAKQADRLVALGRGRLGLVHDEISRFDLVYGKMATFLSKRGDTAIELPSAGGMSVRQNLTTFAHYEAASSAEEPILQAADLVASSVARFLRDALRGRAKRQPGAVRRIASRTVGRLFDQPPLRGTIMAAAEVRRRLDSPLRELLGE